MENSETCVKQTLKNRQNKDLDDKMVAYSDFVTCASCIFCASFCLWDAKFLFRRVQGCNSIADLSLKKVFWTRKFVVGLVDMGNSKS